MDVRIGVIYTAEELDVELADDADRDEPRRRSTTALVRRRRRRCGSPTEGPQVGVPAGKIAYVEIGAPTASAGSASAQLSRGGRVAGARDRPARPPPALRHRQGRRRQDHDRRGARAARRRARASARSSCEVDAKGNLADFFETGPVALQAARGRTRAVSRWRWTPRRRCRSTSAPAAACPLLGPHRPAGPDASTSSPTPRPGVKEILTVGKIVLGGRGSATTTSSWSTRRPPATSSASSPRPQAINELVQVGLVRDQTGWMLEILADPAITGVVIVADARGDAGQRDDRAGRPAASRDRASTSPR